MKQFNVPPTLPLARTRPNPIISRRPNGHHPLHPSFQQNNKQQQSVHLPPPPISPRQASGDMDGGWKISRRPGMAKPKQVRREREARLVGMCA